MADDDYLPQDRIPDDMTVDIAMYIERQGGMQPIDAQAYRFARAATAPQPPAARSGGPARALREWSLHRSISTDATSGNSHEHRSRTPGEP
jgi:hypothetical protein